MYVTKGGGGKCDFEKIKTYYIESRIMRFQTNIGMQISKKWDRIYVSKKKKTRKSIVLCQIDWGMLQLY